MTGSQKGRTGGSHNDRALQTLSVDLEVIHDVNESSKTTEELDETAQQGNRLAGSGGGILQRFLTFHSSPKR